MSQAAARPTREAADDGEHQAQAHPADAHLTGHHGRHRDAVQHQRGGVVEHPLALEDRHDALGQPQAAGDRGGRDRVRRGDDGAEHGGRAPGQPEQACDETPRPRRSGRSGRPRAAGSGGRSRRNSARRRALRRREQQRRQHHGQDQLGGQPQVRRSRDKRHRQPVHGQQHRQRHSPAGRTAGSARRCPPAAVRRARTCPPNSRRARNAGRPGRSRPTHPCRGVPCGVPGSVARARGVTACASGGRPGGASPRTR